MLVEFAILAPLLMALVFGIVDFGLMLSDNLGLQQGTREATRRAAVAESDDAPACTLLGGAATANESTRAVLCDLRSRVGLPSERVRAAVALGPDGYVVGAPIALCAQYELDSMSGMFAFALDGVIVHSRVVMRIEEVAAPAVTAISEPSFPDSSWAECTVGPGA